VLLYIQKPNGGEMTTKKEPLNNGKKVDQTEKTWKINCAYDQLMPIEEAEKK
jgi:hypothetical protein